MLVNALITNETSNTLDYRETHFPYSLACCK